MRTIALLAFAHSALAAELAFSDPANVAPSPPGAVGTGSRAADLDVLPGFRTPPPGFGAVPFYWWLGDPLTRERLTWELDKLAGRHISGLQINYAHGTQGGLSYGLSLPSEPPIFSEEWWRLVGWFMDAAKQRGMAISLSDYTLGVGQGHSVDALLAAHPELNGWQLVQEARDVAAGPVIWAVGDELVSLSAWRLDGKTLVPGSQVDLRPFVRDRQLSWTAPAGAWRLVQVRAQQVLPSLDPLHPRSGAEYASAFFGQFERRFPGEGGHGLNFFFSDELEFRVRGNVWTPRFAAEFQRRKGYDLAPELAALWSDIGPRTPKVRLDYSDVKTALTEEGFFKPVFDWHQQRGMIMGCDHGGRGRDVAEFGDYFRTQRWNQGPGADQPGLGKDLIKSKVASSIAHLYQRPRVWLEGWYGSGWGTSSAGVTDALFADFLMGYNLLSFHGLYYSTHGGWWEWAPPCNCWHMPYWEHMAPFMDCAQRLSYLLTQGTHVADYAVLYPVAAKEAGLDGDAAVKTAFETGQQLYGAGLDFDFMDFESLERATIADGRLHVSGESYRVLVLPAMKAVRHSTLTKAAQFAQAGGVVVAVGALPVASERVGRDDAELERLNRATFGVGAVEAGEPRTQPQPGGGLGVFVRTPAQVAAAVAPSVPRDLTRATPGKYGYFVHRRLGPRDLYALYGYAQGDEVTLRATGRAELWDPWTGTVRPLPVLEQSPAGTRLRLPLTERELHLVVFSPGEPQRDAGAPAPTQTALKLEGDWEFEARPVLDNRFGDFHWPPTPELVGPEARFLQYADESPATAGCERPDFNDRGWRRQTVGYGPQFWKLGPLPADADVAAFEGALAAGLDPSAPVTLGGKVYRWAPYEFSWRYGVEGDPGYQGYHGLKERVYDEFIRLGKLVDRHPTATREPEPGGTRYYLASSVSAPAAGRHRLQRGGASPARLWLNGAPLAAGSRNVELRAGANPLVLRYDQAGTSYVAFTAPTATTAASAPEPDLATANWLWHPGGEGVPRAVFRQRLHLDEPVRAAVLALTADDGYQVWLNGQAVGRGSQWNRVQRYDVTRRLTPGDNLLAIDVSNAAGGAAGLLAQWVLQTAAGERTVNADATWRCAQAPVDGWLTAGFDDSGWQRAAVVSAFPDSLWAKHPQGPPRLDAAAGAEATSTTLGTLAMRWHGDPSVLRFDTRPGEPQPAGWYRFVSAPGLKALSLAVHGRLTAWADGQPCGVTAGARRPDGSTEYRVTVARPAPQPVLVALRVEQTRGAYGGNALPEPIREECGPGRLALGDWGAVDGLRCYSGGAWYRQTLTLGAGALQRRQWLDLGEVVSTAEVRVNGQSAGIRVAPPFRFDVTGLLRAGENRLEVLVYNTACNHYQTIPTRYRGKAASGLLGPVQLLTEG